MKQTYFTDETFMLVASCVRALLWVWDPAGPSVIISYETKTGVEQGTKKKRVVAGEVLQCWYDHLSVLCELMPVALPSLAACLQTLLHGEFSLEAQSNVTQKLGVSSVEVEAMERTSTAGSLFPGRRLAELIVELNSLLSSEELRFFENNMYVRGWFSPYHQRRKMVNPLISMQIHSQATVLLESLQRKSEAVRREMVDVYPDATAQEWLEEHVSPVAAPLQRLTQHIQVCLQDMVP